jgi:hypothetical protein
MFKKIYLSHDKEGYPTHLIGRMDDINAIPPENLKAFSERFTRELRQRSTKVGRTDKVVLEDDADLQHAANLLNGWHADVVSKYTPGTPEYEEEQVRKAAAAKKFAQQSQDIAEQKAKLEASRTSSQTPAVFITPTTPPPNLANKTQSTVEGSAATGEYTKYTQEELAQMHEASGQPIINDETLAIAQQKILANSKHNEVALADSSPTSGALITGDDATVDEINKLAATIEAIETSRDACPDWLNCILDNGLLNKLKDKLKRLLGMLNFLDKLKNALAGGAGALAALLACPTHVAKKGLAGLRAMNKLGSTVSGMRNGDMSAVFLESIAASGSSGSTLTDPRAFMLDGGRSSHDRITITSLARAFKAARDNNPSFNFSGLLSPFSLTSDKNKAKTTSGRDLEVYDTEYYLRMYGDSNSETSLDEPAVGETHRIALLAEMLEKDRDDLLIQNRLAAQDVAGQLPEKVLSATELEVATISLATGRSANVVANSMDPNLASARSATLAKAARFEVGDFSSSDSGVLMTDSMLQHKATLSAKVVIPTLPEFFRREYGDITRGYATT